MNRKLMYLFLTLMSFVTFRYLVILLNINNYYYYELDRYRRYVYVGSDNNSSVGSFLEDVMQRHESMDVNNVTDLDKVTSFLEIASNGSSDTAVISRLRQSSMSDGNKSSRYRMYSSHYVLYSNLQKSSNIDDRHQNTGLKKPEFDVISSKQDNLRTVTMNKLSDNINLKTRAALFNGIYKVKIKEPKRRNVPKNNKVVNKLKKKGTSKQTSEKMDAIVLHQEGDKLQGSLEADVDDILKVNITERIVRIDNYSVTIERFHVGNNQDSVKDGDSNLNKVPGSGIDTNNGVHNMDSKIVPESRMKDDKKTYKILLWTVGDKKSHTLGSNWFGIKEGSASFQQCSFTNCLITSNSSEYDTSDAFLVHMWLVQKSFVKKVPKYRPNPMHKWIMFIGEAPGMSTWSRGARGSFSKFNNMFNATWTYHRKSDIWTNYSSGYFQKKPHLGISQSFEAAVDYAEGKTELVAWFSSNCHATSRRLEYVHSLEKHIPVDIYGKCGNLTCDLQNESSCLEILNTKYKFYLAFENSICEDYITEKLWKIVPAINIIPVVLGGGRYSEVLPPGSYIDVGDFNSTEDLANYLLLLNKSDDLYNAYFQYRKHYDFLPIEKEQCQLCEYMNENHHTVKIYDRMDNFWNQNTDCQKPEQFYKNINPIIWEKKSKVKDRQNNEKLEVAIVFLLVMLFLAALMVCSFIYVLAYSENEEEEEDEDFKQITAMA